MLYLYQNTLKLNICRLKPLTISLFFIFIAGKSFGLVSAIKDAPPNSAYTGQTISIKGLNFIGEKKKHQSTKPIPRTIEKTAWYSADDIFEEGGEDEGNNRPKKYYVVIETFKDFDSADAFVRRMKEERELYTNILYHKVDNKYHVYTYQTFKLEEANEQKRALQELTKYKSVTIIAIEQ